MRWYAAVPAQMWAGVSPSPGADVGRGACSPGADVGRGEPQSRSSCGWGACSPGADVPSAPAGSVAHDDHYLRMVPVQMWAGVSPVPLQMRAVSR